MADSKQNQILETKEERNARLSAEGYKLQSQGKILGDSFGFVTNIFSIFKPLIIILILLLLFIGPGSFAIMNIMNNTPGYVWIALIFGTVLLVKMGKIRFF